MLKNVSLSKIAFLIIALGAFLIGAPTRAKADVIAYYYSNSANHFGTINLTTGAIMTHVVGTNLGDVKGFGVIGGDLFTATGSNLYSVSTTNGTATLVGSAGLTYSALGSTSAGLFAYMNGNDIYQINPTNGSATDKGHIPSSLQEMYPVWSNSTDSTTLKEANYYNAGTGNFVTLASDGTGTSRSLSGLNTSDSIRAMFEEGGTLYAVVQLAGSRTLQAYTIDNTTGVATRYGTWQKDYQNDNWNVQALAAAPSTVPLPSALLLFAPGIAGIAAVRRRFTK
jgi:hypothetical protein